MDVHVWVHKDQLADINFFITGFNVMKSVERINLYTKDPFGKFGEYVHVSLPYKDFIKLTDIENVIFQ
jgi:hypothetical protein